MTNYDSTPIVRQNPVFSIFSILAVLAAIFSFTSSPGASLFLAFGAVILGAIGLLASLSPSRRGGMVSIIAILAGALGIVVAIIRVVLHLAQRV